MDNFNQFFQTVTDYPKPHHWQQTLAAIDQPTDHLIRIPTGFGKTLGVLATWLWHRVIQQDERWPRRLVWCLPMRVLVEQTEEEVCQLLNQLQLHWNGNEDHRGKVGVHRLMGGSEPGEWHLYPEANAVLIGTQDMLLSRALNRGYAAPRARWPMEFGLLNHDSLWVMDEIQLMDVGLATSAQLQAFRRHDASTRPHYRPTYTWWMSATLQSEWLKKSPDTVELTRALPQLSIKAPQRNGPLWNNVSKPFRIETVTDDKNLKKLAQLVADAHLQRTKQSVGPTLVVVNRVDRAVDLYRAINRIKSLPDAASIKLIHSRFRPAERAVWRNNFLNRAACDDAADRIIISTQVIEAGIDLSAGLLITDLAPWASLVQRLGRAARWGGHADVIIVDNQAAEERDELKIIHDRLSLQMRKDDSAMLDGKSETDAMRETLGQLKDEMKVLQKNKNHAAAEIQKNLIEAAQKRVKLLEKRDKAALPYQGQTVEAARQALTLLNDLSPLHLEQFEEQHPELLQTLYPYRPKHLLLRQEIDELFDTTPDLTGADIDISRFIRSGEERDLQLFWVDLSDHKNPAATIQPSRDALCNVPFLKAQEWLFGKSTKLKAGLSGWVWNWLEGEWEPARRSDLYPGQTVLIDSRCGGYSAETGWSPTTKGPVSPVSTATPAAGDQADNAQDDESLSAAAWKSIATHGQEVGELVARIAATLTPDDQPLLALAGRWHDAGKAHPAFQGSMQSSDKPADLLLAKAPQAAWLRGKQLYPMPDGSHRPGFRHELVSVLALFSVLQRHNPDHPALLGEWRAVLEATGHTFPNNPSTAPATALENEILKLDQPAFNLLAYLVCAHHGKIRVAWHASPADQLKCGKNPTLRGLQQGDPIDPIALCNAPGRVETLAPFVIDLQLASAGLNPHTGPGWTERVLELIDTHGPFRLAWLETLLRAADQRASRFTAADPLIKKEAPQ